MEPPFLLLLDPSPSKTFHPGILDCSLDERPPKMARLNQAPREKYEPLFGAEASLRTQIYANRPEIAEKFVELGQRLRDACTLSPRLVELVRLRIAFHNQCRSCMAVRYSYGVDDGLTEDLVCSLEKPQDAEDLTGAERSAIAYADLMATDHLRVTDETFANLKNHFSEPEIMELCFNVAYFVGFGRMAMSLDMVDDLDDEYRTEGLMAPWGHKSVVEVSGWTAAATSS
jgi:alkylhydroperoxidase family enzyme